LPDGKSLIALAADLKGKIGLYRIDAQSGDTALVVPYPPGQSIISPRSSADGKKIYYTRGKGGRTVPKPSNGIVSESKSNVKPVATVTVRKRTEKDFLV
jgi:Tol biopolymer transport system component